MGVVLIIWFTGTLMGALGLYGTLHTPVSLRLKLWCWGLFVALSLVGLLVAVYVQDLQDIKDREQKDASVALGTEVREANAKLDTLASAAGITVKGGLNDKIDYLINNLGPTKKAVAEIAERQKIEKDFHDVAMLGVDGRPQIDDFTVPKDDPLSETLKGAYTITADGKSFSFNTDAVAEQKFREAIALEPRFPFGYFGIGIILYKRGDSNWRVYLNEAEAILEKTTTISGHSSQQDWALTEIKNTLSANSTPTSSTPNTSTSPP